jgi:toxin-antitoxin system PIN domain toxin
MATTAVDRAFVDTNVLVYASRPTAPEHVAARAALARLEASDGTVWISPQVLREYLAVVTRPQATAPPLPMATAIADVRRFQSSFEVADEGPAVLERLLQLLAAYPGAGKQVHDANLVAVMLVQGIRRLLTFNAADFQRFAGAIEIEALIRS